MGVVASWTKGFVDDLNLSTASRSVLENVRVLERAGEIAKALEAEDEACFQEDKTELLHMAMGRVDLSAVTVRFGGKAIVLSESVKWVGLWLDKSLSGRLHIHARATSAVRALNASIGVMHRS
ncbi:hypothetical protein C8J57DRAFT_1090402 [Mycena rebaudengoi]|nr:hypothetical protein C8J57DRAFT_1090402 [Mycena rebaudengoi]